MKKLILAIVLCISIASMYSCNKEDKPVAESHKENSVTEKISNISTIDVFENVELQEYFETNELFASDEDYTDFKGVSAFPWYKFNVAINNAKVKEICAEEHLNIDDLYYTSCFLTLNELTVTLKFAEDKIQGYLERNNLSIENPIKEYTFSRSGNLSYFVSEDMYTDEVKKKADEIADEFIKENNYTIEKKRLVVYDSDYQDDDDWIYFYDSGAEEAMTPNEMMQSQPYGISYEIKDSAGDEYEFLVQFLIKDDEICYYTSRLKSVVVGYFNKEAPFDTTYIEVE